METKNKLLEIAKKLEDLLKELGETPSKPEDMTALTGFYQHITLLINNYDTSRQLEVVRHQYTSLKMPKGLGIKK